MVQSQTDAPEKSGRWTAWQLFPLDDDQTFQRRRKCIFRWPVMGRYWVYVELLYNWVHKKFNQLETRCGRESQHPAEWALRPLINQFGDQTIWREDAGMGTCPREAGPPGPRLSSPGERERNAVMANRVGVNMLQFCSVSNSLSHKTLSNKVRDIFF